MGEIGLSFDLMNISIVIWLCMLALSKPFTIYYNPSFGKRKSRNFKSFFFLFFIFCVFAFLEYDLYHMWDDFLINDKSENLTHYEPIYLWLAAISGMKYFIWRALVWGIAVGSFYYLSLLLKDESIALMFSITVLLPMSYFVATRGSSGHALALLSISMLMGSENLYRRTVFIPCCLLIISFFLHRSNFLFIGLIIISIFMPLMNRKVVVLAILLYPFLSAALTNIINSFVAGGFELAFGDNMNIQGKALSYASREKSDLNAYGILGMIVNKGSVVFITIYLAIRLSFQKMKLPKIYYFYYKVTFVCVYVSMLFAFVDASTWIFERLMFMALFPMCFVFSKVLQNEKKSGKLFKCVVLYAFLTILYSTSYKYYRILR